MGFVVSAVVVIMVLFLAMIAFGARSIGLQRKELTRLRQSGVAYLCLPERGQLGPGMWIVSADSTTMTIRKGWQKRPEAAVLSAQGLLITPAGVQVNVHRMVDGLELTAADNTRLRFALYPDPTLRRTKPLRGAALDQALATLRHAVSRPGA